MKIFCSVNAGLGFSSGGSTVWLDALHGAEPGLSPLPEPLWSRFTAERTLYLATHTHEDHFSAAAAERLLRQYPAARLWAPGYAGSTAAPEQDAEEQLLFREGTLSVTLLRGIHDGAGFADVPTYVAVVADESACVVAASDVRIDPALAQRLRSLCPGGIRVLFLNPYQWGQAAQRTAWRSLHAEHIRLCHLPFPADDSFGLWRIARQTVSAAPEAALPELMQPLRLPGGAITL